MGAGGATYIIDAGSDCFSLNEFHNYEAIFQTVDHRCFHACDKLEHKVRKKKHASKTQKPFTIWFKSKTFTCFDLHALERDL